MSKVSKIAAGVTIASTLAFSGSAFAGSPGQLAGGNVYLVKNLTQKTALANTANATCNDELQYDFELSNTQFGALSNVTVTATIPSNGGVSTAKATTDLGGVSGTSDTASVTLSASQTQTLESGTVSLYDSKGNVIKTLPDTITSGINVGTLTGSTTEVVVFKTKVNCPPVTPPVTPPTTPPVTLPTTPAKPVAPTTLVNTGPGSDVALFVVAVIAGTIGYRSFLSRRLSK